MGLPSRIRFSDERVQKAFEDTERNAFCGIQVPRRLIPKEYNVTNV